MITQLIRGLILMAKKMAREISRESTQESAQESARVYCEMETFLVLEFHSDSEDQKGARNLLKKWHDFWIELVWILVPFLVPFFWP